MAGERIRLPVGIAPHPLAALGGPRSAGLHFDVDGGNQRSDGVGHKLLRFPRNRQRAIPIPIDAEREGNVLLRSIVQVDARIGIPGGISILAEAGLPKLLGDEAGDVQGHGGHRSVRKLMGAHIVARGEIAEHGNNLSQHRTARCECVVANAVIRVGWLMIDRELANSARERLHGECRMPENACPWGTPGKGKRRRSRDRRRLAYADQGWHS